MSVSISVSEHNSWKVLRVTGRVDAFCDKRILAHLRQLAAEPSDLVLDLSACEFLSIWALRSLMQWADELKTSEHQLVLLTPADGVLRQLKVFVGNRLPISWDLSNLEVESFYRQRRKAPVEPTYHP